MQKKKKVDIKIGHLQNYNELNIESCINIKKNDYKLFFVLTNML